MIGAAPGGLDRSAPLARANPVAKLAIASVVALALLLTVDPVTAGVALVLEAVALPWSGLAPRAIWRHSRIVAIGAVTAGVATAFFGVDGGPVLVALGPLSATELSTVNGLAMLLRILAIGLPGVLLLASTDPTDLADSLAQVLRLPHRFVLSALAATRLLGVLVAEWRLLALARRARGVGDEPRWRLDLRLATAFGQVFALLVLAVRRAAVLATTMESRGFGVHRDRTWARPSRFTRFDATLVLAGTGLAAAATAAGLLAGTWNLILT